MTLSLPEGILSSDLTQTPVLHYLDGFQENPLGHKVPLATHPVFSVNNPFLPSSFFLSQESAIAYHQGTNINCLEINIIYTCTYTNL